ncbi:MAG TPA: hypothetical protein VGZ27_12525 [Vicinamibacterales bacterium]|nr:hypothetical protein [Vicinamibacterales bacterium]
MNRRAPIAFALALLASLVLARQARAQDFTSRGFAEIRTLAYPQVTPQDDDRLALEGQLRFEAAYKPADWLTVSASTDARLDNLEQVVRRWRLDFRDRGLQRPALSIRQASATIREGHLTAEVGKQFIRWGKADVLTPTDRFAPRDFLEVTDGEFLAVTGARIQYEKGPYSLDLVWVPWFTPSRIPLLNRRWSPIPPPLAPASFSGTVNFPSRPQYGLRWGFNGAGYEFSLSYFDGFNHLPEILPDPVQLPVIQLRRSYPPLKMAGADAAVPLSWFTVKAEAAFLKTSSPTADDLVLYVIQLERQAGELSLVAGYAGEVVTTRRSLFTFAPDRGLARAFLGRASYTIDTNRSVALEAAVRQNARGAWVKTEYSQGAGLHWRTTVAGTLIGGREQDFFGQFRRNSHLLATLRYSF